MTDQDTRIPILRTKLETEIGNLKRDIGAIDDSIKENESSILGFNSDLRARRSKLQDRLTNCMVTHDQCWPNPWWVLKTLEDFYREEPLH